MHERIDYIKNLLLRATDVEIVLINPYNPKINDGKFGVIKESIEYLKNDDGVDFNMEISDDQEWCKITIKAKHS